MRRTNHSMGQRNGSATDLRTNVARIRSECRLPTFRFNLGWEICYFCRAAATHDGRDRPQVYRFVTPGWVKSTIRALTALPETTISPTEIGSLNRLGPELPGLTYKT